MSCMDPARERAGTRAFRTEGRRSERCWCGTQRGAGKCGQLQSRGRAGRHRRGEAGQGSEGGGAQATWASGRGEHPGAVPGAVSLMGKL